MKRTRMFLFLAAVFGVLVPVHAQYQYTQFGKNQVVWEETTWNFYQAPHFDVYFALDIEVESARKELSKLVAHLEGSYESISTNMMGHQLKKRPIVLVTRTHSTFEALHISGEPFMPEGVGAFAMPRGSKLLPGSDLILVVKPDFLPKLNDTILTHELMHIFQFDMVGWSFITRATNRVVDRWLYEASADYVANKYAPYPRDDIRGIQQRVAATNARNPMIGLPTLEMLQAGAANPYSYGAMVLQYLESEYGEPATMQVVLNNFTNKKLTFMQILEDLSKGRWNMLEAFDRDHRAYWAAKHMPDSLERMKPYGENEHVDGRQILRRQYPYPLTSPVASPDGRSVAFLTYNPKNGIVLAMAPALEREDAEYVPYADREEPGWRFGRRSAGNAKPLVILTDFMPPKHHEDITAQRLSTWPFNGSDADWWQDEQWVAQTKSVRKELKALKEKLKVANETPPEEPDDAQERLDGIAKLEEQIAHVQSDLKELNKTPEVSIIAYFGRKNRDHALFLFDVNTRKVIDEIEVPQDQAFSPVFSPDGNTVYFSAAENIQRSIYALDRLSGEYRTLTSGGVFNSAPAVSPTGTQIVYVAFVGGFQKLFLLDTEDGSTRQLTYGRWNDDSPSFSSDASRIVFTSDEQDGIWNLYSIEFGADRVSQWTNYFAGAFTPRFVHGENDRVVLSVYLEDDQFRSFVYPNFELFDVRLKEPFRTYQIDDVDKDQNMELAFRPQRAVTMELDQRQLDRPQDPPARWKLYGNGVSLGASSYWGAFGYSRVALQDLLAERTHQGLFAQSGHLRMFDYSYTNTSKRWAWTVGGTNFRYPQRYQFYSPEGRLPVYPAPNDKQRQIIFNQMWVSESSARFAVLYPFDKYNRVEFGIKPRVRSFEFFELPDDLAPEVFATIPESDRRFSEFFSNANGHKNVGITAAYVRDTRLFSPRAMGTLHGTAARAEIEYGPGLGADSPSYLSMFVDYRRYKRLTGSALLAGRCAGLYSTRPTGDLMLLGGTDSLRAYPYLSVSGNQVGYCSGELRFPVADGALFGMLPFRVRGSFFGDYASTRFSRSSFPGREDWSYGISLQIWTVVPLIIDFGRTKPNPHDWTVTYRIGYTF